MEYIYKKIGKISFGTLSPEMIKKISVCKIVTPELYDKEGYPVDGGLMDVRMGVIDPGLVCPTDGKKLRDCPGYFVYIELFKPILEGNPYGSFGIQALEAAAMGKSVVTQNMNEDVYFNEYGFCRLMLANNETDFKDIVELLDKSSPDEIKNLQEETRQWVVDNHSYKSTGLKLLKKILN